MPKRSQCPEQQYIKRSQFYVQSVSALFSRERVKETQLDGMSVSFIHIAENGIDSLFTSTLHTFSV